jgi:hypothetical protein
MAGEQNKELTTDQLINESVESFQALVNDYSNVEYAQVDKFFFPVPGTWSIFNPFKVFRYSKFGLNAVEYLKELHYDAPIGNADQSAAALGLNFTSITDITQKVPGGRDVIIPGVDVGNEQFTSDISKLFKAKIGEFSNVRKTIIENPSAANIIEWSRLIAGQTKGEMASAMSPTPYTARDFLWCKYYGKVPNNRMVTLRRYHMPVEDNLKISPEKGPLIPLAQAVTWYGADVGNAIGSILPLGWGLNWAPKNAKVQDIQGNEITIEELLSALGVSNTKNEATGKTLVDVLKTQIFSGNGKVDILKLAGYDKSIQEYIKSAYSDDGPYWNRILGPVNVIDSTQIRSRGFTEGITDVTLNFEYSLRSFGAGGDKGINPKIAFLDLISNFLSLTYNSAPFWGGGSRYFQKTGVSIPGLDMENQILEGDVLGAIQVGIEQLSTIAGRNVQQLISLATSALSGALTDKQVQAERKKLDLSFEQGKNVDPQTLKNLQDQAANTPGLDPSMPFAKLLAPRIGELLQKPLIYRSVLDGRATGEWHITVGNPMNPWAVMGNLLLKSVKVTFDENLSIDDFPTEVKFAVTLGHGRPRAKQDIESIFNLGNGALGFSKVSPPSSAYNSYGETSSNRLNSAYGAESGLVDEGDAIPIEGARNTNGVSSQKSDAEIYAEDPTWKKSLEESKRRVTERYGEIYGNAPILQDYFLKVYTKD